MLPRVRGSIQIPANHQQQKRWVRTSNESAHCRHSSTSATSFTSALCKLIVGQTTFPGCTLQGTADCQDVSQRHINGGEAESICRKCESWCQLIGNQQVFITKVSKHCALRGKSWKWGQHNGYVSQSVTQIQDCIHRRSSQSGQSPVWKQNQDARVQGIDSEEQQKTPKSDFQLFELFGLQAHSHGDDAAQQLQPRLL